MLGFARRAQRGIEHLRKAGMSPTIDAADDLAQWNTRITPLYHIFLPKFRQMPKTEEETIKKSRPGRGLTRAPRPLTALPPPASHSSHPLQSLRYTEPTLSIPTLHRTPPQTVIMHLPSMHRSAARRNSWKSRRTRATNGDGRCLPHPLNTSRPCAQWVGATDSGFESEHVKCNFFIPSYIFIIQH